MSKRAVADRRGRNGSRCAWVTCLRCGFPFSTDNPKGNRLCYDCSVKNEKMVARPRVQLEREHVTENGKNRWDYEEKEL